MSKQLPISRHPIHTPRKWSFIGKPEGKRLLEGPRSCGRMILK
jgi:hypothetical protein